MPKKSEQKSEDGTAIIVAGDRHYDDHNIIGVVLAGIRSWFGPPITVFHGGAKGADKIAGEVANQIGGINTVPFPVDWKKAHEQFGDRYKIAGPRRNKRMLRTLKAQRKIGKRTFVVIFHDDLTKSKGSIGMAELALEAGHEVYLISRLSHLVTPE